jgi:hypothetical protein
MPPAKKNGSKSANKVASLHSRRSQRLHGPSASMDNSDSSEKGALTVISWADVLEGRVESEMVMDVEDAEVFGWDRVPNSPSAVYKYVAKIDSDGSFEEARLMVHNSGVGSQGVCQVNKVGSIPASGSSCSSESGRLMSPGSPTVLVEPSVSNSDKDLSPVESSSQVQPSSGEKVSALKGFESDWSESDLGMSEEPSHPKVSCVGKTGSGSSLFDQLRLASSEFGNSVESPEVSIDVGDRMLDPAVPPLISPEGVVLVNFPILEGRHAQTSPRVGPVPLQSIGPKSLSPETGPASSPQPLGPSVSPNPCDCGPSNSVEDTLGFEGNVDSGLDPSVEILGESGGPENGPELSKGDPPEGIFDFGPLEDSDGPAVRIRPNLVGLGLKKASQDKGNGPGPVANGLPVSPGGSAHDALDPKTSFVTKSNGPGPQGAGLDSAGDTQPVQGIKFGSFVASVSSPPSPKFEFDYNKFLGLEQGGPDISIMGSKLWNHDLFQKLVSGVEVEDSETRLLYDPPSVDHTGELVVKLNGHFMAKCTKAYALHLYGYLVGTTLPFFQVKHNLIRMWHQFGLQDITRNNAGYYFFRFDNEDGMYQVLNRGPWLVNDVPLIVRRWEPDACLNKPDPSLVPIWVSILNLPLSLWNGGSISQIVSCIGHPIMLDKPTFDRCEKKDGVVGFARVLVLAMAKNGLPDKVKVQFPSRENGQGKVCYFDLGYNWKPPLCSHCNVFGHESKNCVASVPLGSKEASPPVVSNAAQHANVDAPHVTASKAQPAQVVTKGEGPSSNKAHLDEDGFVPVKRKKRKGKPKVKPKTASKEPAKPAAPPRPSSSGPALVSAVAQPVAQPSAHQLIPPSLDKGKAVVGSTIPVSNVFSVLNDSLELNANNHAVGGPSLPLGDDEKETAHAFIKLKALPPLDLFSAWSRSLKGYFLSLCKDNGLDPDDLIEGDEVSSEDGQEARAMRLN